MIQAIKRNFKNLLKFIGTKAGFCYFMSWAWLMIGISKPNPESPVLWGVFLVGYLILEELQENRNN